MSSRPALVSSPAAALTHPHRRCLFLRPTCASRSSRGLACGGSARYQPQPRLVAAESPPPLAAGAVRRDAETGLALLLVVLSAVMSFFLSLTILSFSACRALQKLETAANKLSKVVAEEVPGTLSALKLSFLEINDLTSQLKNLRKRLTLSRFGKESSIKAHSRTAWPKQGDT
ncbi:uncharacterized protein LOC133928398 [Phragmites australis]|uniref:uncharacterized protein LOC133928398 n=1 Tax=Phragmites australis TaxID=29695 RepID=UPI002D794367|nr:uncharacterized protein LOC133928398 [Phragmites australis]XP_062230699.1 uncharacterized protein LOC133928398 [Phragmites australis]